jgi:hypothetical protein
MLSVRISRKPSGTSGRLMVLPLGALWGKEWAKVALPRGAPPQHTPGNQAVVGGTGAFLGVRGEWGSDSSKNIPVPAASVSEDPANRRLRKGGGFASC